MSMLKHFTLLCSKPGAVKPIDLLNTVTALVPYAKSQKSLVVPITISMGVSSWIGCKGNSVSPQLMSNLLLFLAKMGAKSVPLIDLFNSKFAKKLGDFQDEVCKSRGISSVGLGQSAEGVRARGVSQRKRSACYF